MPNPWKGVAAAGLVGSGKLVASTVGDGVQVTDGRLVGSDDGVDVGVAGLVGVVVGEGCRVGVDVDVGVAASAVVADITVGASGFSPIGALPQQPEITARMLRLRRARIDLLIGLSKERGER
jgi:hypothetical protein